MAVPYPDFLPYPVRDNYAGGPSKAIRKTAMDDGQERNRRVWNKEPRTYKLTWKLNWDQLLDFEGFLEYDLLGGVEWFEMKLAPNSGNTLLMRFVGQEGPTFQMDENTGAWLVNAEVEFIAPGPVVSPRTGVLPSWPLQLPDPEKGGYRYAQEKTVTRSNLEEGIATQVRRFWQNVTSYTLTWILEEGERQVLDEFYRNTLINGLAWFNAPFANGTGYTFVRAKFVEPIKYQSMGAAFQATAVLCTVDAPRVSELQYLTDGRVALADGVTLNETISLRFEGRLTLSEEIFLTDSFARVLRLNDAITLEDALSNKVLMTLSEAVTLTEAYSLNPRIVLDDGIEVTDDMSSRPRISIADTVSLLDEEAHNTLYKIAPADTLFLEEGLVLTAVAMREIDDLLPLSENGLVVMQDYFQFGYFAEDYFGESRTF